MLGTTGLALLAHFLALPRADLPSDAHPVLGGFVLAATLGFALLLVVGVRRLWRERAQLTAEFFDPARGGAMFFVVLCPAVLGLGLGTYFPDTSEWLGGMWLTASAAWLALALGGAIGLCLRPKPAWSWQSVTPGWLLPGAALHALLLLRLALEPVAGRSFFALAVFLAASVLVSGAAVALAARWLLGPIEPQTFGPSQWINLGAMGISALSAAQFAGQAPARLNALLSSAVVLFWILGCAWLPLLLAAGYWRHRLRQVPFTYVPENWALVFSPAVFGVATLQLRSVGAGEWIVMAAAGAFLFAASAWAVNLVAAVGEGRKKDEG